MVEDSPPQDAQSFDSDPIDQLLARKLGGARSIKEGNAEEEVEVGLRRAVKSLQPELQFTGPEPPEIKNDELLQASSAALEDGKFDLDGPIGKM